ncbi:MAG: AAA family ATPase [Verrucomicrobiales bacterium]|nr:AAA family ATPase [Verrucomicrobiales bacterium]
MSRRPTVITGGIEAKERAVLNSALCAAGDPLTPFVADIIASPEYWLSDPRCIWLAGRIGSLLRSGFPVSPEVILPEDKTGIVAELLREPPLPLAVAEIEAQTVREAATARLVARELDGVSERILEKPSSAPAVAYAAADALRAAFDRAAGKKGLSVRSPDEILAMPTDPSANLLGARLLTKGGRLVIAGAGGVGKSRIGLQLVAAIIAGRDFLGLPTYGRGTRWLVLQAENDNDRLKSDLGALREWLGSDWPFVQARLRIHTLEHELDTMLALDDETTATAVRRLIETDSFDGLLWDSLYNYASGDLNKDQDMRAVLTRLQQIGCHRNPKRANVVLHHATTGKTGLAKASGIDRASFGRNSKVLHSWARGQINVAPLNSDDNELLAVVCGKASNGREFPPFAARLDPASMVYSVAQDVDVRDAMEAAQSGKAGSRPQLTNDEVAELAAGKTKAELARVIEGRTECSQATAYRLIDRAEEAGVIRLHRSSKTYQDTRVDP